MATVIAVWPNNTISVIRMWQGFTMVDLYSEIDNEHSPLDAKCYLVGSDGDGMHITFDWKCLDDGSAVSPASKHVGIGKICGKIKKLPWPKDIQKQWWRKFEKDIRREDASQAYRFLSADELPKMPTPPPPSHSKSELKSMGKFCGVYLSYDPDGSCHYVGESENVPKRVNESGRPEIQDRMIGFVRCAKHERRLIEAYFVAILNPPANGISTHRMSANV